VAVRHADARGPADRPACPAPAARGRRARARRRRGGRLQRDRSERELSLFALGAWGYERGWQSAARLEVLNAAGEVLASRVRPGGVMHATFLPFVAPQDGRYALVLGAEDQYFRYVLERHSGYVARPEGAVYAIGARDTVHGYLADQADSLTYAVDVEAGVPLSLRVSNDPQVARNRQRNERARQLGRVADKKPLHAAGDGQRGRGMEPAEEMRARMRAGPEEAHASYPALTLELRGEELGHYQLLTPEVSGQLLFEVRGTSRGEGGLFVLEIERDPELVGVHGHVGDAEDDPVEGVQLDFLREPDFDPVGRAVTGPDGTYALDVPPGTYQVLLRKDGRGAETLRLPIEEARAVNAFFGPRR
jgi:hypothetical protein